jgi:hypothetical protein
LALQELRHAVSVIRPELQAAQDQDFERTLQKFEPLQWIVYGRHTTCLPCGAPRVKPRSRAVG